MSIRKAHIREPYYVRLKARVVMTQLGPVRRERHWPEKVPESDVICPRSA